MKTSMISKIFAMAALCLVSTSACFAENPLPVEDLPVKAQAFVASNFERNEIVAVEMNSDAYMCLLDDGTIIDFKKNGTWNNVDCKNNSVPLSFIPRNILKYVYGNYPCCTITKVNKEKHGYEVQVTTEEGKNVTLNVRFHTLINRGVEG